MVKIVEVLSFRVNHGAFERAGSLPSDSVIKNSGHVWE